MIEPNAEPNLDWIANVDLDGLGDWREQARPVENREWQRQRELIVSEMERIVHDPRFKDAMGSVAFLCVSLSLTPAPTDTQEKIVRAGIDGLIGFAASELPTLRHVLGSDGLGRWVFSLLDARVTAGLGEIGPAAEGLGEMAGQLRLVHAGPDNPSGLQTGGSAIVPAEASDVHRRQVRDLQRARRAPGHAGRPKGAPKPKASGQRRIPLDRARAVRAMKETGATNKEIALRHYPHLRPDSAAARRQIQRDVERADLAG